jgi:type IV pilus assembly protein PilB
MVGEIRDFETASLAVQAALTGHMVFSTLHTNDASGAITRFIDMGIEPFLVSSTMTVSFAQRLVRKVCPNCMANYRPSKEALKAWGINNTAKANFVQGKGCFNCMHTGYKGRTGVYEVMTIDDQIKDLILRRESSHRIHQAALESGNFTSLKDNAAEKAIKGITTLEEAASAVLL